MAIVRGDIARDFLVLSPSKDARQHAFTPTFFHEDLPRAYPDFSGHELISCFDFDRDWSTWERHPRGDEIVLLLSGRARLLLRSDAGEESVDLAEPGHYVVVPRGCWHTARTDVPTRMLFITPGQDTENAPLD